MRGAALFAAIALLPAVCGLATARAQAIEVGLCEGGTLAIPLPGGPVPPAPEPCCSKGCHAHRKRAQPQQAD